MARLDLQPISREGGKGDASGSSTYLARIVVCSFETTQMYVSTMSSVSGAVSILNCFSLKKFLLTKWQWLKKVFAVEAIQTHGLELLLYRAKLMYVCNPLPCLPPMFVQKLWSPSSAQRENIVWGNPFPGKLIKIFKISSITWFGRNTVVSASWSCFGTFGRDNYSAAFPFKGYLDPCPLYIGAKMLKLRKWADKTYQVEMTPK